MFAEKYSNQQSVFFESIQKAVEGLQEKFCYYKKLQNTNLELRLQVVNFMLLYYM